MSCHLQTYQQTSRPNHASAGFPTTLRGVPQAVARRPGRRRRSTTRPSRSSACTRRSRARAATRTASTRARRAIASAATWPTTRRRRSPNHAAAGFATTCETCHRADRHELEGGGFNHASAFALVGLHATQPCASCHKNGVYKGTPRDCVGCHLADYQRTTSPNHAASGFATTCEACHRATDTSWTGSGVQPREHLRARRPARDAAVRELPQERRLQGHAARLRRLPPGRLPAHDQSEPRGGGIRDDLRERATGRPTRAGRAAAFNHASTFALVGLHATQPCASCHKNGVFKGTPRDCVGCHLANYQRTTNPNHAASGFPTTCEACHRATDTSLDAAAPSTTRASFPLVGLHATQPCANCHTNGVYKGTPRDCVGCHLANYQRTTNPNHAAAGFPTTCDACHSATERELGRAPCSITAASSRSSACTRRSRARTATRTTSTGARRATAPAATWPTTRPRPIRTTRRPGSRPPASTCHRATDTTWKQGQFSAHGVPDYVRPPRGAHVRDVPHDAERVRGVLVHHRVPRPRVDRFAPQRTRRLPLRLGGVLLVPSERPRGQAPPAALRAKRCRRIALCCCSLPCSEFWRPRLSRSRRRGPPGGGSPCSATVRPRPGTTGRPARSAS